MSFAELRIFVRAFWALTLAFENARKWVFRNISERFGAKVAPESQCDLS